MHASSFTAVLLLRTLSRAGSLAEFTEQRVEGSSLQKLKRCSETADIWRVEPINSSRHALASPRSSHGGDRA